MKMSWTFHSPRKKTQDINMLTNKVILVILISLVFIKTTQADQSIDLLIKPATNVGAITKTTTEADLKRIYGAKNVQRYEVGVGEGEVVPGTILFPGTKRELTIEWEKAYRNPVRITISKPKSEWSLNSGIKIGSTQEEVEKANGGDFKLTGFEWDYPGRTVSWEKAKLPPQLQLDLDPTVQLPWQEYSKVLGDNFYSTQNKVIRKLKLVVSVIYIRWDI